MIDDILKSIREKMEKTTIHFRSELKSIRTGRASISLFDNIKVDYYGTPTPINQLSTLHTPDPHTVTIQPWDPSSVKMIEKAILGSNLGLNPTNDGKIIRVTIPPLTEERRTELTKIVKKMAEDAKIAIRNERRLGLDNIRKGEKEGEISEDIAKKTSDDIQQLTDEFVKKIDELVEQKINEIMEI
ncbi:MAG: ribosome recycling factor [Deferribacterota bacterium]|nr:ribosome recycling factor [Deferribacterota bacterium]